MSVQAAERRHGIAPAAGQAPATQIRASRLASVDRLRGLIIVIMAIDHASLFIAHRHSSESWSANITAYTSAFPFLTRFVTHLCAPGFFFTMGIGMAMFAASRKKSGWSDGRISTYMLTRGMALVMVNQLVENPAWLLGTAFQAESRGSIVSGHNPIYLSFGVISALGVVMGLGGTLLRLSSLWWIVAGLAGLMAGNLVVPGPMHAGEQFSALARMAFIPGQAGALLVIYPAIPWFPLTAAGVIFGRWLQSDPRAAYQRAPWIGLSLIAAALILRWHGGFGNILPPRDGSWIEFLNFVKYPPALVFSCSMLGANLVLLAILAGRDSWAQRTLSVYGRAPLCFYIVHLYLYALLGALFFRHAISLQAMYVVWVAGLIPLYFVCRSYRIFKESRPAESLWRLF